MVNNDKAKIKLRSCKVKAIPTDEYITSSEMIFVDRPASNEF